VTHLDEVSDHYYLNSDRGGNQNKKRKYTLEELEVEGIATPTEESLSDASGTKSSEFEEEEGRDQKLGPKLLASFMDKWMTPFWTSE